MTTSYAQHFSTRQTPQSEPIPGSDQVPNSAGGHAFAIDDFARLGRWLVLGSEGGSYYAAERALTVDNAKCVMRCLDADPERTVRAIVEVSVAGRAPKQEPALFALAMAAGHRDQRARAAAYAALPQVCRIGTHIFQFTEAVQAFRGWGQGLRRAVAAWYTGRPAGDLAFQVAKYQRRNGWSHKDLIRLAHPEPPGPGHEAVFRWIVGGQAALAARTVVRKKSKGEAGVAASYADVAAHLPPFLAAFDEAKAADEAATMRLIREHHLPRECVQTRHLNSKAVWEALLERMKPEALIRNLGKMTAIGLLAPFSEAAKTVADRLGDAEDIRRSRLHPLRILVAAKVYGQGRGDKGSLSWTPVSRVNDALDAAFYLAFGNVEPSGKRTLIAVDVSGSMGMSTICGSPLTPREGAAALAMVAARTEPAYQVVAFTAPAGGRGGYGGQWGGGDATLTPVDVSASDRLSSVVAKVMALPMGGTDCSLPMRAASEKGWQVDTFQVLTDNETWHGPIHPCQALVRYRERSGIPARLAVVGMTATNFSIADPNDAGSMDFVGFDTATPGVLADFSAGRL